MLRDLAGGVYYRRFGAFEGGSDMFSRNVFNQLQTYAALYPRTEKTRATEVEAWDLE